MEAIFKKLPLDERGINVEGERLTDLRFADDVALITSTVKDMETQLNDFYKESKKVGLKMHKGKTKYRIRYSCTRSGNIFFCFTVYILWRLNQIFGDQFFLKYLLNIL